MKLDAYLQKQFLGIIRSTRLKKVKEDCGIYISPFFVLEDSIVYVPIIFLCFVC